MYHIQIGLSPLKTIRILFEIQLFSNLHLPIHNLQRSSDFISAIYYFSLCTQRMPYRLYGPQLGIQLSIKRIGFETDPIRSDPIRSEVLSRVPGVLSASNESESGVSVASIGILSYMYSLYLYMYSYLLIATLTASV